MTATNQSCFEGIRYSVPGIKDLADLRGQAGIQAGAPDFITSVFGWVLMAIPGAEPAGAGVVINGAVNAGEVPIEAEHHYLQLLQNRLNTIDNDIAIQRAIEQGSYVPIGPGAYYYKGPKDESDR